MYNDNKLNTKQSGVISGSGFENKDQGPYIFLDGTTEKETSRTKIFIKKSKISIKILEHKLCTGPFNLLELKGMPCPKRALLDRTKPNSQCFECFSKTGFNPSFYHVDSSTLSPQQKEYNEQPHIVYLAFFGEEKVKIGIANKKRYLDRWLEQGAILATIIGEFENAYDARKMEESISKQLGLPESVRIKTKYKLLSQKMNFKKGKELLSSLCNKIGKDQIEIVDDLTKYYMEGEIPQNSNYLEDVKNLSDKIEICGLVGKLLLCNQEIKTPLGFTTKTLSAISFDRLIGLLNIEKLG